MAQRKQLLSVDYHYDTDTGIYEIGEIDFGISGEFESYVEQYGRKGLNDIIMALAHLIWHCEEYGGRRLKTAEPSITKGEE